MNTLNLFVNKSFVKVYPTVYDIHILLRGNENKLAKYAQFQSLIVNSVVFGKCNSG